MIAPPDSVSALSAVTPRGREALLVPPSKTSGWIPVALFAGLIFFLSAQSSIPIIPQAWWSFDKLMHAAEYGTFGFLLARGLASAGLRRWMPLFTMLLAGLYGVTDECHQYFVPGRSSDPKDAMADTVGGLLGGLAWLGLLAAVRRSRSRSDK